MILKKTALFFAVGLLSILLSFGNATNVFATNANPPIADAGPDQTAPQQSTPFGSLIYLDGSGSYDPDGEEITYSWTIETFPEGSSAMIFGENSESPLFLADIGGIFELKLVVHDCFGASDEDTVTITVAVSGTVTVPNFVNMDFFNDVLLEVFVSGLELELSESSVQYSDDIPYEHVISQSIPAGSVVEYGTPISFVVSAGQEMNVNLTASHDSPVQPGTTVVFTALAEGSTGNYEYKFAMKGPATSNEFQVMQDYSTSNSWSWDTTTDDLCGNKIYVYARSIKSESDDEVYQTQYFEVLPLPVTVVNLTASHESPLQPGTTVVFTALAEGGSGDFEYKFKVKGPSTGDEWVVAQEYSSNNTLSGVLTCNSAGIYKILVYARSAGSCADYDTYAIIENIEILPCAGNNPPISQNDVITTDEDNTISAIPVLSNDTDPDSDELTIASITQPANGIATNNEDGTLGYSPNENYFGDDAFTYTVSDGNGGTSVGTVTVSVNPVNDTPIANAGIDIGAYQGETVVLDGSGSHDPDGDEITYSWAIEDLPANSNAVLSGVDSVNPTFSTDMEGTYVFELIVSDGISTSTFDQVIVTATIRMVTVPDLIGLDQTVAASQISSAGLTVGVVETEYSDTIPANTVISQSPSSGSSVEMYTPVDITVSLGPANAEVSLSPSTITIVQGESATLSWSSTGAENAHIDNGIGSVPTSGSVTVSPEHTTIYTLTISGPFGAASAKAEVHVTAYTEPQPEGTFGETYNDEIPQDATVERYDEHRFALIRGAVVDVDSQPIEDILISIHGHPEYGTAMTDAQGQFTLPVEGGSMMTAVYQKQGVISSHRKVKVPWNNTVVADTVTMIAEDPASTTVTFDNDPSTVIIHRSSAVTDDFGTRSTTVVFSGDNQAYLADENGNAVQELDTIITRATEYPTEASMPAPLPLNSGFTFCADLSVDGAERVQFENPVVVWVENFIGFDVGTAAPVGYFDKDKGQWLPEKNGSVVQLLDVDSDGVVDALDASGDGQPNDLNADGDFADEVQGLYDPAVYTPGSTYWRVEISHFSSWDINWPVGPPPGAEAPTTANDSSVDSITTSFEDCVIFTGSHAEVRKRVHHEDIPIPGTGFKLHYSSSREHGYKQVVSVPASGDTVPDNLTGIVVQLKVAGRIIEQVLPALPNQKAELVWDGIDFQGTPVHGSIDAVVALGYVYDGYYYSPSDFSAAFAQNGNTITGILARQDWIYWDDFLINLKKGQGGLTEGWSISEHHYMDLSDPSKLFKGDGTVIERERIISTIAGNGTVGYSGDGGAGNRGLIELSNCGRSRFFWEYFHCR